MQIIFVLLFASALAANKTLIASTEMQVFCSDEELDPQQDSNVTCEDRKARGECEMEFMISGQFCHIACGYCVKDVQEIEQALELEATVARSFIQIEEEEPEVQIVKPKNTTLRGCKCPTWIYNGTTFTGCGNPNRSPIGGWCPVDLEECAADPQMTLSEPISIVYQFEDNTTQLITLTGEYNIDSCDCFPADLCSESKGGCACTSPCQIPDHDRKGPWCFIEPGTCREGYVPSRENDDSGMSDYCKPGCCPN
eukprot:TRINITY_DN3497_c0_g1_i1.p2 TRINITY_DN3497_c0_g1~~TRINITY_DN3497_c0_g1_i1.p2  ORF type:complete len:253 (+),score=26.92 TRINITY_DN3497_c0_g1_i1:76-834(+)